MTYQDTYNIRYRNDGPAGWVDYVETMNTLSFPWEGTTTGFTIEVPNAADWDNFCHLHGAPWAAGRRDTILDRIGKSAAQRYWWGSSFEIREHDIDVVRDSLLEPIVKLFKRSER